MRTFGLIGLPLGHSFSKKYFSEKFEKLKIENCAYQNFEIPEVSLVKEIVQAHDNLQGLNVTIPYKESVIPHLDNIDAEAKLIGSVNCIHIDEMRQTTGYNTDAYGFYHSIKPFLENKYERALILGTGGSSKAVAYVLKKLGLKVYFATRNPKDDFHMSYKELTKENIVHFPLIINTTPVGMFPNTEACPDIPYDGITEKHFLYDLIYNPEETLFLKTGKEKGAQVSNGKLMLQLQAEKSWQIWNR